MIIALIAAALAGGGAYLVLQRGMVRIIIGMTFISHAANLIILSAGVGAWRQEPLMARAEPGTAADALPQAFVLTAIVITMAVTAFMLAMAALGRDDDTRVKEDREANAQLSTAGRAVRRSDPSDVGAGAGAARSIVVVSGIVLASMGALLSMVRVWRAVFWGRDMKGVDAGLRVPKRMVWPSAVLALGSFGMFIFAAPVSTAAGAAADSLLDVPAYVEAALGDPEAAVAFGRLDNVSPEVGEPGTGAGDPDNGAENAGDGAGADSATDTGTDSTAETEGTDN